jgi:uncharacterized protein YdaU (DUF1376 family)
MFDFIKHDVNASSDPKIMRLRMKHKSAGYGVFWLILEKLTINGGELEADFNTLGYEFRESAELVKSVVCDFDLFVFSDDGKRFSSLRLMKSIEEMQKKSEKAKESVKKRWEKYKGNTTVIRTYNDRNTDVIQNRIEENRIEENRINISPSKNDGGECVQPLLLPSPSEAKKEVKDSKQEQLQLEADFNFFWKIYPRHVSKKDSLRAYCKARKKASADELLEALREVKSKEWRSKELQYIPHASTWLNQERWNDEVTEAKKIDPLDDLDLESNPFEVSK